MIKATFHCNGAGHVTSYQISGHAQSGPYGQDIVCAAVSVVSIGTINSLQEVAGVNPHFTSNDLDGGFLQCAVDYPKITDVMQQNSAITLMDSCYQIMKSIVANYSDFIQIELLT
ncbi:ribosomal-processing cysteine protease Prp [Bombilactobacillus thymidiniphilus]|uniref:Ribosomal processing cysteine protease Prp n=1 Tax=Bombilactobacillus thymidiniphilus TaxID=2923363 RepID=A0ABY4PCS4_9LACO|nr:ribosomal-processing cysteine protease Prp [Bombilactobacillus thymidiniphilus]UQS83444.1 ribosomal-processing cysteine protease Prp [Bombilactobacillus thymidiniphilus]